MKVPDNLGADIGAMAEAVRVFVGGPQVAYVLAFGTICAVLQIFLAYRRYVAVLKWLTLALFAYVATLFFVKVDWRALLSVCSFPAYRSASTS